MSLIKTSGLFVLTAIAEIVGCYLPYLWIKKAAPLGFARRWPDANRHGCNSAGCRSDGRLVFRRDV
jgi:hypothetical protein